MAPKPHEFGYDLILRRLLSRPQAPLMRIKQLGNVHVLGRNSI